MGDDKLTILERENAQLKAEVAGLQAQVESMKAQPTDVKKVLERIEAKQASDRQYQEEMQKSFK